MSKNTWANDAAWGLTGFVWCFCVGSLKTNNLDCPRDKTVCRSQNSTAGGSHLVLFLNFRSMKLCSERMNSEVPTVYAEDSIKMRMTRKHDDLSQGSSSQDFLIQNWAKVLIHLLWAKLGIKTSLLESEVFSICQVVLVSIILKESGMKNYFEELGIDTNCKSVTIIAFHWMY